MNNQRNDALAASPVRTAIGAAEDALRGWSDPATDAEADAIEPDGGELAEAMAYLAERERT